MDQAQNYINNLSGGSFRIKYSFFRNLRLFVSAACTLDEAESPNRRKTLNSQLSHFRLFRMADSPPRRNSRSPSPWREESRSRSRSKSRSRSRSLERPRRTSPSRGRGSNNDRVEAVNPGNTLYVTGLSTRVTERELEDHFSKEGKVASCFLVVEPRTRISRGFAFVTMDNVDDANRCVKYLNQSILEGRYITVEKVFRLYSEQFCVSYVGSNQFIHVNLVKQHDQ
ncbi:Serine/arginine-rich splicing factor SR45a [Linum perenne]